MSYTGGILNACDSLKEANLKGLRIGGFQLQDVLEKVQLWRHEKIREGLGVNGWVGGIF